MSKSLSAFLSQNAKKPENVKYVASKRFEEDGKPIEWEISPITAAENVKIRKDCMRMVPVAGKRGQYTQELDSNGYQLKVAVRCTAFPDLNDTDLQNSYNAMNAEQLLVAMLTPAEFEDYSRKVFEANGFQTDDEIVEEAKN